jgi:hypothetical protein
MTPINLQISHLSQPTTINTQTTIQNNPTTEVSSTNTNHIGYEGGMNERSNKDYVDLDDPKEQEAAGGATGEASREIVSYDDLFA